MRYTRVALRALGHLLPPRVVTSAALEDALAPVYAGLDLPPGRIETISGIRERRLWEPGTRPSGPSTESARRALAAGGLEPAAVGALVHCSVSRDFLEPATASAVAGALGLAPSAFVCDVSNACLGFMNGLVLVANMIELGQIEAGLVVATECAEGLVDATVAELNQRAAAGTLSRRALKPAFASLTIGSGSAAALLTSVEQAPGSPRLLGGAAAQATEHFGLCRSEPDQGFAAGAHPLMETDAEAVLQHGVVLARATFQGFGAALGWSAGTPDHVLCHQVGAGHKRALFEALGLDPRRDHPTLERFGNVGSVSLPLSLAVAAEAGRLRAGERVALLGIGSGLNSIMLGLEW